MIEQHFYVPFVAALALREKQVHQNYRPVIAVHKWFARRPGTLFRALIYVRVFGEAGGRELLSGASVAGSSCFRSVYGRGHDHDGGEPDRLRGHWSGHQSNGMVDWPRLPSGNIVSCALCAIPGKIR
jgi:hypothetical protein